MGLEADDPVDHVDARLFEGTGPADVGLLVEARLQLDDRRHLLAVLGRPDQRGHDGAVPAGAVERLLDPQHGGVLGRLGDEGLDRGGEGVVGVVDQHVALAQDGEELGRLMGRRRQAGRRHGRPGLDVQVGTVQGVDPPQPAQVERGRHAEDAVARHLELGGQQLDELLVHVGAHLESQGPTEPAAAQLHLNGHQQVVRLVLFERQVGVAGDAEGVVLPDAHAREQGLEMRRDHLLQRDEPLAVGHDHEARQDRRDLDPRDATLAGGGVLHLDHQVE